MKKQKIKSPNIFWKVVRNDGEFLWSYIKNFSDIGENILVKYEIGQWAFPVIPNSKLFCFKTKEAALNSCGNIIGDEAWEVEVGSVETPARQIPDVLEEEIVDFWLTGDGLNLAFCPNDTVWTDKVKLIKKIS